MVTKNDCMIPQCGQVPSFGSQRIVVGAKQLKKAVLAGTAQCVYLAEDADPALTEPLEALCREHGIPYSRVPSMADLGRACNIEVGAAAAATVGVI